MRCSVLLVLGWAAGACSHPTYPPAIGNVAERSQHHECSTSVLTEVAAVLRSQWGEAQDFLRVSCVAGYFPEPGYFISVIGPDPGRHRFGLIFPGRTDEVTFANDPIPPGTDILHYAAADLDGDGVDEILETWHRASDGVLGTDEWVVIRRVSGEDLVEIAGPHLNVQFPHLGGCMARCEIANGMLIVTVSNLPGIPPSDCLTPGKHVFTLHRGELVGSVQR